MHYFRCRQWRHDTGVMLGLYSVPATVMTSQQQCVLSATHTFVILWTKMHRHSWNRVIESAVKHCTLAEKQACFSVQCCMSCREAVGLSGRSLRKLPFLAHALYVQVCQSVVIALLNAIHAVIKNIRDVNSPSAHCSASDYNLSEHLTMSSSHKRF